MSYLVLQEAFALFDRDRDGEINTEELAKVRGGEEKLSREKSSNWKCYKSNQV